MTNTIEIDMEAIRRKAYFESALKEYSRARAGRLAGFISAYNYARITRTLCQACPDFAQHLENNIIAAKEA